MQDGKYDAVQDAEFCFEDGCEDDETPEKAIAVLLEGKQADLQSYLEDYEITLRAIIPDMLAEARAKAEESAAVAYPRQEMNKAA